MFGAKKEAEKPAPKKPEVDWRTLVEPGRAAVQAKSAANLLVFQKAHEDDLARFRLTAVRNGDYLTVSVVRPHAEAHIQALNERDEKYPDMIGRWGEELDNGKETQSLNLAATRTVIVKKGQPPSGRYKATLHRHWGEDKLDAYVPELSGYSRFRDLTPPKQDRSGGMVIHQRSPEPEPERIIDGVAAPAEDDLVIFTGINMAICVPAGMGEAVREQILAAMSQNNGQNGP